MEPVKSGGKVILLGEHAVVHGIPALAAGIGLGVRASVTPASDWALAISPWDLVVTPTDESELGRAFAALLEGESDLPPHRIEAEVELPAGAGLGCSAALGVAVVRALDRAGGREAPAEEVAERALAWERVFHGNPSGLDNHASAMGGVLRYVRGEAPRRVHARRPLHLVIGDSGESASTKAMVASVARQLERDPPRMRQAFDAIRALVDNAQVAIEGGDASTLGQLLDLNHALLGGMMLSTPALEEMCAAAREAGAFGAKLTGSGGGGCMIALVDEASAEPVRGSIESLGRRAFIARTQAADDEHREETKR